MPFIADLPPENPPYVLVGRRDQCRGRSSGSIRVGRFSHPNEVRANSGRQTGSDQTVYLCLDSSTSHHSSDVIYLVQSSATFDPECAAADVSRVDSAELLAEVRKQSAALQARYTESVQHKAIEQTAGLLQGLFAYPGISERILEPPSLSSTADGNFAFEWEFEGFFALVVCERPETPGGTWFCFVETASSEFEGTGLSRPDVQTQLIKAIENV